MTCVLRMHPANRVDLSTDRGESPSRLSLSALSACSTWPGHLSSVPSSESTFGRCVISSASSLQRLCTRMESICASNPSSSAPSRRARGRSAAPPPGRPPLDPGLGDHREERAQVTHRRPDRVRPAPRRHEHHIAIQQRMLQRDELVRPQTRVKKTGISGQQTGLRSASSPSG